MADFLVSFDLDDIDCVANFDEEVRIEFATLRMLTFLPREFD